MKYNKIAALLLLSFLHQYLSAQPARHYTHADTLRGSVTRSRNWWDVQRYDLQFKPDYSAKTIAGINSITYKVIRDNRNDSLQIDLQEPLIIDSIVLNKNIGLSFTKNGNAW
ncbi:MAG: M1 family peptidase, partial [Chitinophagaceae bacterium]